MGLIATGTETIISRRNGTGSDATPYRFVSLDTTDAEEFAACGANGVPLGVLLRNVMYESGLIPSLKWGDIQTDGIADVDAGGAITAGDLVNSDSSGKAVSVTTHAALSYGTTKKEIAGTAMETCASGGRLAVKLCPRTMFIA